MEVLDPSMCSPAGRGGVLESIRAPMRGAPEPAHPGEEQAVVEVGQRMRNRGSGESYTWLATRASTGGAYCEFEVELTADAQPPTRHRHPRQEERFTVLEGALRLQRGGVEQRLVEGESEAVPPDVPHIWFNGVDAVSRVRVRFTPALDIEDFFAGFCAIDAAGRANAKGLPRNPLEFAVLADAHRGEIQLPTRAQQAVGGGALRVLALIGRLLGIRAPA